MEKTVVLVTKPYLGSVAESDQEFGAEMLDKFFHTLERQAARPLAICFYTEGVKVLAKNSPFETGIRLLSGLGIRLIACGSCVQYYGLEDQLVAGEVAGMPDIVQWISQAEKCLTV